MEVSYVSSGAVLSCSLGTITSVLEIQNYHRSKMYSKNQATVEDCKGGLNIKPFQMCKRTLPNGLIPCTPKTCMKWLNGKKDFRIDGEQALLTTSIIPCLYGGIITIEDNSEN